jgi:glutathione S-transferase
MLKLYMHPLSTYARRVRIALLEKNLECEQIVVDMAARKHREPDYLALNPYGRVPTLVDGDFILYESTAILTYLEALHPAPALAPSDAQQRALVEMHMKLCDLQFTRPCSAIMFPKRFLPKERWDESAFEQARGEMNKHLAVVARQLGDREFLVGDRYSLADVCYAPFVAFFDLVGVTPPPAVARWGERLLARPSAQRTAPAT